MSKTIYLTILALVTAILVTLPIVFIPISSSSRGVIRSVQENTQLTAVVSGRVIETKLEKNNQNIKKGETLLIVTAEQLDTKKIYKPIKVQTTKHSFQTCKKYLVVILQDCRQGNTSERSQLCKKK